MSAVPRQIDTDAMFSHAEEKPLGRELQARELARIMASVEPEPVIFLGYVVTKPHAARRLSLLSEGHGQHPNPTSACSSRSIRLHGERWTSARYRQG